MSLGEIGLAIAAMSFGIMIVALVLRARELGRASMEYERREIENWRLREENALLQRELELVQRRPSNA